MTITREGKQIQLTREEMRQAYEEQRDNYMREDLVEAIDEIEIEGGVLTENQEKTLLAEEQKAKIAENALPLLKQYYDNNTERGDVYWFMRRKAVRDAALQLAHGEAMRTAVIGAAEKSGLILNVRINI